MRLFILTATLLAAACDSRQGRPAGALPGPGITPDETTSTGGAPRLDLPEDRPLPDLPDETGESSSGSTGEPGTSSSGSTSTGESGTTSTGDLSSSSSGSTSTGEASSSTGEPPPPAVCGDGVCEASERAPCWGPGWCFPDCYKAPECKSDCPCTPAAAVAKSFCFADPPVVCAATAKGGYCDPDGNGLPDDADDVRGFYEWSASCG